VITNLDGSNDYLSPPCSLLAAAPGLHGKMLEILKG